MAVPGTNVGNLKMQYFYGAELFLWHSSMLFILYKISPNYGDPRCRGPVMIGFPDCGRTMKIEAGSSGDLIYPFVITQ